MTKVIEGFVSLCCLGNRNINQDAVCRGLELGASEKGEDGGPRTLCRVSEALDTLTKGYSWVGLWSQTELWATWESEL